MLNMRTRSIVIIILQILLNQRHALDLLDLLVNVTDVYYEFHLQHQMSSVIRTVEVTGLLIYSKLRKTLKTN
jgi:hypothetical protein